MKIQYLGTGAAERVPALFCACDICNHARKVGGKEIRTQTQVLLDEGCLLIDFPADSYLHLLQHQLNFNDLEHLLITHWHGDNFYGEDLAYRMSSYANHLTTCLTVYGSSEVKKFFDRAFELEGMYEADRIRFVTLEPFQNYMIGGYQIHVLPANHGYGNGDSLIYVIQDQERTLFYAHDTGFPTEEVFDYLVKEKLRMDYLSLDCTGQGLTYEGGKHMTLGQNIALKNRLKILDLIHKETILIASHFSHNGGLTHAQMEDLARPHGIITSFDGMMIEF